ncbi:DUF559 domain-containing protein [Thiocystis minor]|uniref:DUF559 domain-containing protein n=1 Tax=Thiocystis minor TaxID=61597 RepID=UPI0019144D7F|nr:DUF559 domain-containing protein [Thiocystis minor]
MRETKQSASLASAARPGQRLAQGAPAAVFHGNIQAMGKKTLDHRPQSATETSRDVLARLEAHHCRRRQQLPTVTVLAGPSATAYRAWTQWNARARRSGAVWSSDRADTCLDVWLAALRAGGDVLLRAPTQDGISGADEDILAQLPPWLRERRAERAARVSDVAVALARQPPDDAPWGEARTFAWLLTRLSAETLPGLLIVVARETRSAAPLEMAARIAEQAPRLPLAVAIATDRYDRYLETAPESRYKAILREGVVRLAAPSQERLQDWFVRQALGSDPDPRPLIAVLARHGAAPTVLREAVSLLRCLHARATPEDSAAARSQAERFLFRLLESIPELAGRFRLNAQLAIPFGNRPLEVDLLADPPGVAVEIDGYHHFQDAARYRRDRRKDLALQQQGLLVLRFLAEDVVSDLESILDTLRHALQHPTILPARRPPE